MGRTIKSEHSVTKDYVVGFILIFISAFFVFLVFAIFNLFSSYPTEDNWNYGFGFGGAFACLFQISFYIAGGMERPLNALLERWTEFFSDIQISFGFAVSGFFDKIKEEGSVFLWYILILLCTIIISVYGFSNLIEAYEIYNL